MTKLESRRRGHSDIVNHFDYHATLMHLYGLDAKDLTLKRNAREESILDGQPGKIIGWLLKV